MERSVFLGGLIKGTTGEMVHDALRKIGLVVVNDPALKHGYCRQVVLETVQGAERLLKMKRVHINGSKVNIRRFANIRNTHKKKRKN